MEPAVTLQITSSHVVKLGTPCCKFAIAGYSTETVPKWGGCEARGEGVRHVGRVQGTWGGRKARREGARHVGRAQGTWGGCKARGKTWRVWEMLSMSRDTLVDSAVCLSFSNSEASAYLSPATLLHTSTPRPLALLFERVSALCRISTCTRRATVTPT